LDTVIPRVPERANPEGRRNPSLNPRGRRRDERLERQLEGAMIVQSLVTAFTIAFLATAMFGHVLLRAIFVPANNRKSGRAAERASGRTPIAGPGIAA